MVGVEAGVGKSLGKPSGLLCTPLSREIESSCGCRLKLPTEDARLILEEFKAESYRKKYD